MKKKILSLLALSLAFSCNAPTNIPISKVDSKMASSVKKDGNTYVIDASQGKSTKGADLTFNLGKSFSIKQSSQGTVNLFGSIKSYVVYLVSDVSGASFSGTDPIGNKVLGPFVFNVNNNVFPSVRFTNVPSSGAGFYYVAVRALDGLDGTGTDLIKANNGSLTPWTGTTSAAPLSGKIAVSSGAGISVSPTYVVSPTTAPIVNINTTLGATGAAVLDARLKFLNTASTSVASYSVNLCTDPTRPVATKVLAAPLVIPKNPSFTDDVLQLTNVPQGTYYLTVTPVRDTNLTSPNLIAQLGLPNADASNNIAVSSNYVTIDNNQQYTFYNNVGVLDTDSWFKLSVPLVSKVIYPISTTASISANNPYQPSMAVAPDGTMYVSDVINAKIIKIASDGTQSDFLTAFPWHYNMTTDKSGNLYIAVQSGSVQVYDSLANNVLTISKNPGGGNLVDPTGVAVDGEGNIYVSEVTNIISGTSMIYKYDITGTVGTVIAGGGTLTGAVGLLNATNPMTGPDLRWVSDVAVTPDSSKVYICEAGFGLIKQVENNTINTIVGGAYAGASGGRAVNLSSPSGIELDNNGFLYIADTGNDVIRKYDAMNSGAISIFAGTGTSVPTSALQLIGATLAKLNMPFGLSLDPVGNVYLTDKDNAGTSVRILKVTK